jgi:hypothetical protein
VDPSLISLKHLSILLPPGSFSVDTNRHLSTKKSLMTGPLTFYANQCSNGALPYGCNGARTLSPTPPSIPPTLQPTYPTSSPTFYVPTQPKTNPPSFRNPASSTKSPTSVFDAFPFSDFSVTVHESNSSSTTKIKFDSSAKSIQSSTIFSSILVACSFAYLLS